MRNLILVILLLVYAFNINAIVSDGELANQTTFNNSFMSRDVDTSTVGSVLIKGQKQLQLEDITNQNYVALRAPEPLAATLVFTLPGVDGSSGDRLLTDGSGNLFFSPLPSDILTETNVKVVSNKSIDADSNTITNIDNADIKAAAAIARSKLADATANYVLINNGTGGMSEEQFLDRTRGGTGITSTAIFPATGTIMFLDGADSTIIPGATTTGLLVLSPDVDQNITAASDTIIITKAHNEINPDADYVMTSTPTIPDGTDGQILILNNISIFTIDIQDEAVLTGSNVQLGGSESAIRPRGAMTLFFSGDTGFWTVLSNPNTASQGANASVRNVRNISGSPILAGQAVYSTGHHVGQDRTTIDLADADDPATGEAIGFTATAIGNNANGEVITDGNIATINTTGTAVNDGVYVGTTPGSVVFVRPSVDRVQKLGIVSRVNVLGRIIVRVTGPEDVPNQPSFTDFINANHDHSDGSGGGFISSPTSSPSFTTVTKSASTTLATTAEDNVVVDATVGDITLSLPPASNNGLTYKIVKSDSSDNLIILDPNGSETINGSATTTLHGQYGGTIIASDGSGWFAFSGTSPPVAFIKDVKSSGTNGGTFNNGAWRQRDLNTLIGGVGFVSLSSNEFTLQPGMYLIEAFAPAVDVNDNKAKLVRDPSGTPSDEIIGSATINSSTVFDESLSRIFGIVIVATATAFDIQHQCATSSAGDNGFGEAASFSVSETYTIVKITKVR